MKKIKFADLRKTVYYLKRNGLKKTLGAVRERMDAAEQESYRWEPMSMAEREAQSRQAREEGFSVTFSIVTPTYRTPEKYLRELIESLRNQSYDRWELVLADATGDDSVKRTADSYGDDRIRYIKLGENGGIAGNTNSGLAAAQGDYIGLVDHDDVLTENALFEMASEIERGYREGGAPMLLYSDEDKCNGEMTEYYDPNRKEEFNLDLLLSNNYICHFLVMKRELIQSLGLRGQYEGAQDYDLVLRAAEKLGTVENLCAGRIRHIPLVLYHWRCHSSSTAANPASKRYAYEAGRRALQEFVRGRQWKARAVDTEHLGFYRLEYEGDLFESRKDVGAVGGRILRNGRVAGGRMSAEGRIFYQGLPAAYSGYLHRAVLPQDAEALDLRNIRVAQPLWDIFSQAAGVAYRELPDKHIFDVSLLPAGTDVTKLSIRVSLALRKAGYRLLYLPEKIVEA